MSSEQKLKEEDKIVAHLETTNRIELLFFTNQQQVYKTRASEFGESKASVLGDYVPAKLGLSDGELVVQMIATADYSGDLLFVFANGKAARVPLSAYATKTNRKNCKMPTAASRLWCRFCRFPAVKPPARYLSGQTAIVQSWQRHP